MVAFSRVKERTIFFASLAHLFPEHASPAVSRPLCSPLTPLEKRATRAQPLRHNAPKPARIFTGFNSGHDVSRPQRRNDLSRTGEHLFEERERDAVKRRVPRSLERLGSDVSLQEKGAVA